MPHVAILVPGVMGSVLELDGEIIWPGPVTSLIFPYGKMKELLREELVATDCIRSYFITDQYQQLINDLATCGFLESDKTLRIAAYDWRRDNAQSAETLAGHIDEMAAHHGAETEISLIAHSMGGLICRHYLESGRFNSHPGFPRIRRMITLATPHRGAALALPMVLGYEKRLFLSKDQVLQICSDTRYPAAYQLLPPEDEPFAWDGSIGRQLNFKSIYDSDMAKGLGLVQTNLEAAVRFSKSLDLSKRPPDVRYFCFAGTNQTTASHIMIRPMDSYRLEPVKIEQEDSGDGTVPTWSGFLTSFQRLFVGGEHGTIYQNRTLRQTLATLLGREGILKGVPKEVQVSLREKVVEPQDIVHVAVIFSTGIREFSGVLTIERAQIHEVTGKVEAFGAPVQVHAMEYKGLGLETMSITFEAPDIRGVYRVALRDELAQPPAGYDELIVQEPPRKSP